MKHVLFVCCTEGEIETKMGERLVDRERESEAGDEEKQSDG